MRAPWGKFVQRKREDRETRRRVEAEWDAYWESLTPEQKRTYQYALYASDDWEDRGYFDGR